MADGRWAELTFFEQMANIGSEVIRALKWREKGKPDYASAAADRALELLWLTIDDPRNRDRLKKLCRLYEYLADYFYCDNAYSTEPQKLRNYCFAFNYAARLRS
ncbi:MAG: hypothetical protein ACPL7K_00175 [Armatimonadota bacterium]